VLLHANKKMQIKKNIECLCKQSQNCNAAKSNNAMQQQSSGTNHLSHAWLPQHCAQLNASMAERFSLTTGRIGLQPESATKKVTADGISRALLSTRQQ